MSTPVQSSSVLLKISFDAGVTYKDLVCLENYSIEATTTTTTDDTLNCGRLYGLGPIGTQITGTGVCETTPLSTQVTQKDLRNAQNAGTLLYFAANYPTIGSSGGQISNNASGFVTAVGEQFAAGALAKFTFTFSINGSIS